MRGCAFFRIPGAALWCGTVVRNRGAEAARSGRPGAAAGRPARSLGGCWLRMTGTLLVSRPPRGNLLGAGDRSGNRLLFDASATTRRTARLARVRARRVGSAWGVNHDRGDRTVDGGTTGQGAAGEAARAEAAAAGQAPKAGAI